MTGAEQDQENQERVVINSIIDFPPLNNFAPISAEEIEPVPDVETNVINNEPETSSLPITDFINSSTERESFVPQESAEEQVDLRTQILEIEEITTSKSVNPEEGLIHSLDTPSDEESGFETTIKIF